MNDTLVYLDMKVGVILQGDYFRVSRLLVLKAHTWNKGSLVKTRTVPDRSLMLQLKRKTSCSVDRSKTETIQTHTEVQSSLFHHN